MRNEFINSALNYTGGKFKLLPQLFPMFPKQYENFIDLFAGGGVVSINIANADKTKKIYMNDSESHVIDLYKYFSQVEFDFLIKQIDYMINLYGLSDTYRNGYEYYGADSSTGLGKVNKEAFLKLREDYNCEVFSKGQKQIAFYVLIVFGFNNQIRFNSKGKYNLPVGKRDFNKKMREKLYEFHLVLRKFQFVFLNEDFRKVDKIKKNDFVYVDPPYRITTAAYNENGGWNLDDDIDLFNYLDTVDGIGAKFALSNVVVHNDVENHELVEWMGKYNLNMLNFDYNNSNYQSKAKKSSTVEVLITNYKIESVAEQLSLF